ncbi:MAG: hypothetical protein KBE41_02600 [Lutibacter sp.]|nr:hypothetical protein [Lutibacter sp.]MBP9600368.1 hypothetical protein [Lutibacter sp.]
MEKTRLYLMILMVLLGAFTTASASEKYLKVAVSKEIPAEVKVMLNRLDEIKEIDKSDLSRAEKKELRTEVRAINKAVRSSGNGIYLSAGAIIIIFIINHNILIISI